MGGVATRVVRVGGRVLALVALPVLGTHACSSSDSPSEPSACEAFCRHFAQGASCGGQDAVDPCTVDCASTSKSCPTRADSLLECLQQLAIECQSPGVGVAHARGVPVADPPSLSYPHGALSVEDSTCAALLEAFVACAPSDGGSDAPAGQCAAISALVDDFESGQVPTPATWESGCDSLGLGQSTTPGHLYALACTVTNPAPAGPSGFGTGVSRIFSPPIDAAPFEGLHLSLVSQTAISVRISIATPATLPPPEGNCGVGTCDPGLPCPVCFDHFGLVVPLVQGTNQVGVPFASLAQVGFGDPATFDPSQVVRVNVQGPPDAAFTFAIDELGFCN